MNEEILQDYTPSLHDIHRCAENTYVRDKFKPVVGNFETRMTIPLVFALRGVPAVIKGPSGSGKSTIVKFAALMVWGEGVLDAKVDEVFYIGGSSDKGFITEPDAQRIANVCTHCVIPELQNACGPKHERSEAIIKLWAEDESYTYQRAEKGGKDSSKIILTPLPIMTSIATENKYTEQLGEEMERRFFPFYTIATKELNKKIHRMKALSRARNDSNLRSMSEEDKRSLRAHFRGAMEGNYQVKNPMSIYMEGAIPSNYVVSPRPP